MRAWTVHEFGAYREVLHLEEIPPPRPGPGSVVARVLSAGINFQDTLLIAGQYQTKPPTPFVPGFEVVGEVVDIGKHVHRVRPGDRVIAFIETGGYAQYALLDPQRTFLVPASMTADEAAAFLLSYQTAYFALVHRARLRSGEILLVHAGAGGLGSASIQLGKALGATVIATAGSDDKVSLCRGLGADHAINYAEADFASAVREITKGAGADVVVDPVGGEVFASSTKCIAWQGRIVTLGFACGEIPTIAAHRVLLKNIAVVGLHWSEYWRRDRALIHETQEILNELFAAGKIRPVVSRRYRMEELPDALGAFEQRKVCGKAVLAICGT